MIGNVTRSSRDTVLGFPLMVWSRKRFQELLIAYYWQLHIEDPMLELRPTCEHSQQGAASRFAWCAHMLLRVHLLQFVRRKRSGKCLSKLRWRVCPSDRLDLRGTGTVATFLEKIRRAPR